MPVDPDIKAILEQIAPLMPENFDGVDPAQFRALSDAYSIQAIKKIDISRVEDILIPSEGVNLTARLYSDSEESDSLIVYYHGGGFVIGNIETHDSVCRVMSKYSGSKVISVDYRLAPEHKFPAAVEDAYNAFLWARENAEKLEVSKEKLAIAGDSAGGNLCAAVSLMLKEKGQELPKLEALFYPAVAPDQASKSYSDYSDGLFLTGSVMEWFGRQYTRTEADFLSPYFSPLLTGNLKGMPETILVTAEYDPLRDQGETFAGVLRKHGTRVTAIRAMGMIHGFLTFHEQSEGAHNVLTMASRLIGDRLRE